MNATWKPHEKHGELTERNEERALAFANIKQAADHYGVDISESDWEGLGSRPHTGRTAEDRRESARAAVETKRERGELSDEARKAVETKRESGVLTEEARKAVETKRERTEL